MRLALIVGHIYDFLTFWYIFCIYAEQKDHKKNIRVKEIDVKL